MIKGIVHNNQPLISLAVGWSLGIQEIVALIDTGFSGELKVSPTLASQLGLETTHAEPVTLADETTVNIPASLAVVSMENTKDIVSVLIAHGIPIIGVGLLKRFGYALHIDFKKDALILQK